MDVILSILSAVTVAVIGFLILANLVSIVGYALHQRRFVERFQRSILRFTTLLRLGIR
jgi:hypothetical protein